MTKKPRDYKKEYESYHSKPEQIARRAQRNSARAAAVKSGKAKPGDGREVDHLGSNRRGPLNNKRTKVVSRTTNRKRQPKRDGSED